MLITRFRRVIKSLFAIVAMILSKGHKTLVLQDKKRMYLGERHEYEGGLAGPPALLPSKLPSSSSKQPNLAGKRKGHGRDERTVWLWGLVLLSSVSRDPKPRRQCNRTRKQRGSLCLSSTPDGYFKWPSGSGASFPHYPKILCSSVSLQFCACSATFPTS